MGKVLLHIGTGKTGTSTIQDALNWGEKRKRLIKTRYPGAESKNHNYLAALYKSGGGLPRRLAYQYEKDPVGFKQRIDQRASELFAVVSSGVDTIISGEYLSNFNEAEASALCKDLRESGASEVIAVLYVREPSSYYLSYVQQQLRASHRFTVPRDFRYRFRAAIKTWEATCTLSVRPFARSLLRGGDIVSDFMYEAVPFFNHEIARGELKRHTANETISAEGMIVAQRYRFRNYRDMDDVPSEDSSRLFRRLQDSWHLVDGQTRPQLRQDRKADIVLEHESDVKDLAESYGCDLQVPSVEGLQVAGGYVDGEDVRDILASYDEEVVERLYSRTVHG